VFGEHPHLLKSFLNSLLPLETPIDTIEYLPAELVPEIPVFKNSIVDVRCVDLLGRQFIVEMQMLWTDSFKSRVVFNASKAFVRQIERGEEYKELHPVYSLCIINENFEPNLAEYQHHYKIVHVLHTNKVIPGLEFVFIELPKFKAQKFTDKKLNVLWLRFLSEIKDSQEELPIAFLEVPEIKEATELLKESSFTKAQLETYDKYWDSISTEKTRIVDAFDEGKIEGKTEGKIEGIIRTVKKAKLSDEEIADIFDVNLEFILEIKKKNNL
jgi:predicted transposase/invertase (TIGR01784 family)